MLVDMLASCEMGQGSKWDVTHRHWLVSVLENSAKFVASQLPINIVAHDGAPGYLRVLGLQSSVIAPFHLAEFVSGIDLDVFRSLAEKVRCTSDSTMCLSGSNTFNLDNVGDVDFCEYVSLSGNRVPTAYFIRRESRDNDHLIRLCHNGSEFIPIQNGIDYKLCVTDTGTIEAMCECEDQSWYFEFVTDMKDGQFLPVSNMAVPSGNLATKYSFAYQEAIFVDVSARPRDMCVPTEFEGYVSWLVAEIEANLEKDKFVKALKRALSLAALMHYEDHVSEILRAIENPALIELSYLQRIEEIRSNLELLGGAAKSDAMAYLSKLNERRRVTQKRLNSARKIGEVPCRNLLSNHDALLADAKKRLQQ